MHNTTSFCIDIQMSDGGKLITADKSNDMVCSYLTNVEMRHTRERVQGLLCPHHYNFPEVKKTISEGLIVIRVQCCCEEFFNIVDTRFQ